jgi:hypothetical protein
VDRRYFRAEGATSEVTLPAMLLKQLSVDNSL